MILHERCQRENLVGKHPLRDRVRWRLRAGPVSPRQLFKPARSVGEGRPSRFAPGARVQVLDADAIRATLDSRDALRGLQFLAQQWDFCGLAFVVHGSMRRMIDDEGVLRAVHETVTLEGATCDGMSGEEGCGRACFLLWRDAWLRPAGATGEEREPILPAQVPARVRPLDEIRRSLDPGGGRDGLKFMPEMARLAGEVIPVRQMQSTGEAFRIVPVRAPVYFVSAAHRCSGSILGEDGPCRRECPMIWHRDWLDLGAEPA